MSTILDALKKSEQERKKNHIPTLSDMPVPEESARWPLYVIAILSLLLACLLGVVIANWYGPNRADEQRLAEQAIESQKVAPQTLPNNPVMTTPNDTRVDASDADVANIILNVVSYSEEPNQRFVMLDGKMYRENDFVRAGLKVEQIKPNAVVLNWRGELMTRTP